MVSNEFINECKNRANSNRLGQLIVDEMDNPITQSDKLQSFTIDSGCYVDGNIIGSVYVKKLTGKILDSANVSLVDKTIQAKIGVKYIDNSTEYLNIGKYTIERPTAEKTVNMSEFTAYNGLINKLDDKYVCNIDYSKGNITLADLYKDVCSQMNLTPTTITFDNSSIPISANPFTNGEKNRTVLQVIAKIAGSWIEIDDDSNEVDLHWLSQNSEPDYIFNLNDYSTVEGGEITCGPINCLIIKNSQVDDENITITDDESIALYGENSIVINEDYILYNSNLRQQAINAIWNKVHGLNYVDCKLITYYGKPFLKLGDKIRIYTNETEYFDTYVLKHNFTYDGTFTSVIESPVLTKQEIKNKQNVSLGELLRNTRIDVNKQEQKINLAVETAQEAYNKVEVYNPVLESTGNGQLSLPDCAGEELLEFTVDGKSEQETTTSNLFDKSTVKVGYAWTWQSGYPARATGYVEVKNNVKYKIKVKNLAVQLLQIQFVSALGSGTTQDGIGFYGDGEKEFVVTGDTKYAMIQFTKSTDDISTSDYSNTVIEVTTDIPSPDYPSEIKSISGVENLLNISEDNHEASTNASSLGETTISFSDSGYTVDATSMNSGGGRGDWFYVPLITGKTYTLKYKTDGNFTNVRIFKKDKTTMLLNFEIKEGEYSYTFTAEEDGAYFRTWTAGEKIATLNYVMITKGSISHPYVPYGSNYLVEKVVGKNNFDYSKIIKNANINSSGTIISSTPSGNYTINLNYAEIKPNTTYVLSSNITRQWVYNFFNEIPKIGATGTSRIVKTGLKQTFTTPNDAKYIVIREDISYDGSVERNDNQEIQLEENIQTEYEEYKETISSIDLKGNKLCSNKEQTIKDKLTVKNGLANIDKRFKEIVLDGSDDENFVYGSSGIFYINMTDYSNGEHIVYSDQYILNNWDDNRLVGYKCGLYRNPGWELARLWFHNDNYSDVASFKSYLSQNPVTVQYELATPETIDLGEVSIQTLQSDCTLILEEELYTDMYAKYIKNNPYNEAYSTRLDTKAQIQLSENKIESSVSETILQNTELMQGEIDSLSSNLANNYMTSDEVQNLNNLTNESLAVITNEFKQIQTSTQTQFQAITNILQNGVSLVKTTYITIDGEGLKIAKSTDSFNGVLDNKNLRFYSYENLMSVYSNKGAGFTNLLVTGQADIAYSKIMKVTQNGKKYTGIFYSDAMAQTLEDFIGE